LYILFAFNWSCGLRTVSSICIKARASAGMRKLLASETANRSQTANIPIGIYKAEAQPL
jgi:hypothetical protein